MKKNKELFCSVCGVSSKVKNVYHRSLHGSCLCEKHWEQFRKFGKFKDNNPRGVFDPNEIRINNDYLEIDTYDSLGNVVETYICDLEDEELLKAMSMKWRTVYKTNKPYLFTGNQRSERIYFHRFIMNVPKDMVVDHINGNTLDNRKINLRVVNQKDNHKNVKKKCSNTSGIRGVSWNAKSNRWKADFTYEDTRFYFKEFILKEEAVYLRYLCEVHFLKDFRYTTDDELYFSEISKLSAKQKLDIEQYFKNKLNISKERV